MFAPKPRDYRISVPKKVRRLAMKSALSCKVNDAELVVVDKIELAEAKTKERPFRCSRRWARTRRP